MDHSALPDRELLTPLKGDRRYVHSTDVLAALEIEARGLLGGDSWVRQLVIRRQGTSMPIASFAPQPESFATFRLAGPTGDVKGWLVESGRAIESRVPFEERVVTDRIVFTSGPAILPEPVDGFTRFEQVLLLAKAQAQRTIPGTWVVNQLDFDGRLPEAGPLELQITRIIDGRFNYGVLSQNGVRLGSIRGILTDSPSTE